MPFLQRIRDLLRRWASPTTGEDSLPDPQSIKQRGWRQWACVASSDVPRILQDAWAYGSEDVIDGTRLLVVTQSCDLIHGSYANEPNVDAFIAQPLGTNPKIDGNLTAGKNPRSVQRGEALVGLYINLRPWEELPEEQAYAVDLVGLVDPELDWDRRQAIEKLLDEVALTYEQTDGIESCDARVLDEDEATMSILRTHRLFPLDFLSLRDRPVGDLPPLG